MHGGAAADPRAGLRVFAVAGLPGAPPSLIRPRHARRTWSSASSPRVDPDATWVVGSYVRGDLVRHGVRAFVLDASPGGFWPGVRPPACGIRTDPLRLTPSIHRDWSLNNLSLQTCREDSHSPQHNYCKSVAERS